MTRTEKWALLGGAAAGLAAILWWINRRTHVFDILAIFALAALAYHLA